jgi:hypothetical protein
MSGVNMPVRYKCKSCGFVLYEYTSREEMGNERYMGLLSPMQVAAKYDFTCPRCGRALNTRPGKEDIKVRPVRAGSRSYPEFGEGGEKKKNPGLRARLVSRYQAVYVRLDYI